MTNNRHLNKTKYSIENTDEWYTTLEIIEKELIHYSDQFYNKTVYCNTDNPFTSQFVIYFLRNFNNLHLKRFICSSCNQTNIGLCLSVTDISDNSNEAIQTIINNNTKPLSGNGDFKSDECIELLKQSDIVVTNPPFSLFVDLFQLVNQYNKHYLLITTINSLKYKDIFPYFKENKCKLGYNYGNMEFKVPDNAEPRKYRFRVDKSGQKWRSIGDGCWLTNLTVSNPKPPLKLIKQYQPENYITFDNTDILNVGKIADIPYDYEGLMGVPISYFVKWNPEQYELVGILSHGSDHKYDLLKPTINGKQIYTRLLIRKKSNRPHALQITPTIAQKPAGRNLMQPRLFTP